MRTATEFGRREGVSVLAPAPASVDCTVVPDEAYEEPYFGTSFTLPVGWDADTFYRTEVVYGRRPVGGYTPSNPTPGEDVAPKGSFDDPWSVYEYDIDGSWCNVLTILPDVEPQRGEGEWFGVGRGGPVVAWDSYPGSWDWGVMERGESLLRRSTPSQHTDRARYERMRRLRPARNFVKGGE